MASGALSTDDLRAILAFLRANYALQDHEAFIGTAVHDLPRLIRSDLTAYCEIDPVAQTSENWLDRPEVDTPDAHRIWAERMFEMPVVAHYVGTGDGRALRITDFMSQRQFRNTGVYCEHYRPKDLEYVLATWVPSTRFAIAIGLHRGARDFTDRERLILELLRPHLIQAWRNVQLATKLRADAQRALGALHPDLIVLDGSANPTFVGDRARTLLEAHFGASPTGLPEPVQRWARSLIADLAGAADDVPRPAGPLVHDLDGRRLVARPFTGDRSTVLAIEERALTAAHPRPATPLTPRESEVLACVADGRTNAEIGRLLHCAPKTVEKHLEHIYEKLEVTNRAAAVAVALRASREDEPAGVR